MDKKKVIQYFKAQAINGNWAELYDYNNPISYAFIQRFIKTVNLMKPFKGSILDMGCGTGIMVSMAIENDLKYVGFDAAEEMIEACNLDKDSVLNHNFMRLKKTSQTDQDNSYDELAYTLFKVLNKKLVP